MRNYIQSSGHVLEQITNGQQDHLRRGTGFIPCVWGHGVQWVAILPHDSMDTGSTLSSGHCHVPPSPLVSSDFPHQIRDITP